jgi:Pyrimidine dimer DNA glycosylase
VQTFLPFPDFVESVSVLDTARLGKQRVETLQILRALTLAEYGWRNHPAVTMWRGRVPALVLYGLASVAQWRMRSFPDTTADQIAEFAPEVVGLNQADLAAGGRLPSWVGDERLHRSHQSKLLAKDPAHYGRFFPGVAPNLEYFWPASDVEVADLDATEPAGRPLWIVQPDTAEALGYFLSAGVVGLGVGSGMTIDAAGLDLAGLRAALGGRGRVTRPVLALARFLTEISVGDEIGLLVQSGSALMIGTVLGDYEFAASSGPASHVRPVRWERIVPRGAVQPTAALQDGRPLFRVHLTGG